jgi:hypothetical protein
MSGAQYYPSWSEKCGRVSNQRLLWMGFAKPSYSQLDRVTPLALLILICSPFQKTMLLTKLNLIANKHMPSDSFYIWIVIGLGWSVPGTVCRIGVDKYGMSSSAVARLRSFLWLRSIVLLCLIQSVCPMRSILCRHGTASSTIMVLWYMWTDPMAQSILLYCTMAGVGPNYVFYPITSRFFLTLSRVPWVKYSIQAQVIFS